MPETITPTITPTRTTPTVLPTPDPSRRLRPDTICPNQTQRVAERVKRELRP